MPASVWRWNAASGHPRQSWSVVLEASVEETPSVPALTASMTRAWTPALGPIPSPVEVGDDRALASARGRIADRPYARGEPLVRVARAPNALVVAAHHSVLDGIGLLALLGVALGEAVRSGMRGIGPASSPGRGFAREMASRAAEAIRRPPAHWPRGGQARSPGDHLFRRQIPAISGGTAALVAATATAFRARFGTPERRPVVAAVALSRRPGDGPSLEDRSAYIRLPLPAGDADRDAVRAALGRGEPAPGTQSASLLTATLVWAARPLVARQSPTFLVSNLGAVRGPPALSSVAFWPVPPGRRSFALGAATVGPTTTITLRAARSAMEPAAADELLERIGAQVRTAGDEAPNGPDRLRDGSG